MTKLKIENLGLVIFVSLLIQIVLWFLITSAANAYLGLKFGMDLALTITIILKLGFGFVVNLVIAFWIFRIAKAEDKNPFIWFVLSVFFGLIAVVLLYLELIFTELRNKKES